MRETIKALTASRKVGLSEAFLERLIQKDIDEEEKLELSLLLSKLEGDHLDEEKWKRRIDLSVPATRFLAPVLISIYKKRDPFQAFDVLSKLEDYNYQPPADYLRYYKTGLQHAVFLALNPMSFRIDEQHPSLPQRNEALRNTYRRFLSWRSTLQLPWLQELLTDVMEHDRFEPIKKIFTGEFELNFESELPQAALILDDKKEYVERTIKNALVSDDINQTVDMLLHKEAYWKLGVKMLMNRLPRRSNPTDEHNVIYSRIFTKLNEKLDETFNFFLYDFYGYTYDADNGIVHHGEEVVKEIIPQEEIRERVMRDLDPRRQPLGRQSILSYFGITDSDNT